MNEIWAESQTILLSNVYNFVLWPSDLVLRDQVGVSWCDINFEVALGQRSARGYYQGCVLFHGSLGH